MVLMLCSAYSNLAFAANEVAGELKISKEMIEPLRSVAEILGVIKKEYVDPVDDSKLLDACFEETKPTYGFSLATTETPSRQSGDLRAFGRELKSKSSAWALKAQNAGLDASGYEAFAGQCIERVMSSLDSESSYFGEEEYHDLSTNANSWSTANIGVELKLADKGAQIVSVEDDAPADQGGIIAEDVITHIDRAPIAGRPLKTITKLLRGMVDSKVTITFTRANEPAPVDITLVRKVVIPTVKTKLIERSYGYIRIPSLGTQTSSLLANGIIDLYAKNNSLKGVILDLRGNPGGLLNAAVGVSAAFLPKDVLVAYTQGQSEHSNVKLITNPKDFEHFQDKTANLIIKLPASIKTLPLVVLVDHQTAAGAEMIAGALQDHLRAIVMGAPTYGSASIKTIRPLGRGTTGIGLTTSRWFTPNGRSVNKTGITPDILVIAESGKKIDRTSPNDLAFMRSLELLKNEHQQ